MKIVINTRLLRKGQMDGIGWFTYNTLKYIVRQNPSIEFHFLFDSGIDKEFVFADNVIAHNLFPPAKHAILNVIWFEWSVKNYLRQVNPDLFLSPDGILSLGWKGKQFAIVHDINFAHIPRDLKWSNRHFYNYFFPKYVHRAARIATVSEYSKQDIVQTYGADAGKIDVVYCGINDFFKPVDETVKLQVKAKYTGGDDYFIFVGTLHPRKNIVRLMQAFELFKEKTNARMKLVLAGKEMYRTDEMHTVKNGLKHRDDIIFTGRLDDDALKQLLASAFCLTFLPYFEGFGIPPIEAMQCNVPVIASNNTSIPEVVGDAALLANPYDANEIAGNMIRIWQDDQLRSTLIERGGIRKTVFTWERTAQLLWDSITKVL